MTPPFAAPSHAQGKYSNRLIADKALTYLGKSGTAACRDAGKPGGDQCKQFVNCIVYMVSGHTQYPVDPDGNYHAGYRAAGGVPVGWGLARRGDIIQTGAWDTSWPLHTAIVIENKGKGLFYVVDANYNFDGVVRKHDYRPPDHARIWRMGTYRPPADPILVMPRQVGLGNT